MCPCDKTATMMSPRDKAAATKHPFHFQIPSIDSFYPRARALPATFVPADVAPGQEIAWRGAATAHFRETPVPVIMTS